MKIGIDIDEVLANMNFVLNQYQYEVHGNEFTRESYKNFALHHSWNCTREEADKIFEDFMDSHQFSRMVPIEGSVEATKKLVEDGHELVIVTARNLRIFDETIDWLDKHFPELFSNVHVSQSKKQPGKRKWEICRDENIDVMIDDGPHIITDCSRNGIKSIVMDGPWNRSVSDSDIIFRAKSWNDVLEIIKEIEKEKSN